jgi:alpha-tubulin suppressor-like RCC1 family protein
MRTRAAFGYAVVAMVVLTWSSASVAGIRISGSGAPLAGEIHARYSAGANHACQVRRDGSIGCWGGNLSGQIGDGTTTNRSIPVTVSGVTGAVAVAAGLGHTCALLVDGTARCWGDEQNWSRTVEFDAPISSP